MNPLMSSDLTLTQTWPSREGVGFTHRLSSTGPSTISPASSPSRPPPQPWPSDEAEDGGGTGGGGAGGGGVGGGGVGGGGDGGEHVSSSRRREARVISSVPSSWEAVAEVEVAATNLNLRPVSADTLRGGALVKP